MEIKVDELGFERNHLRFFFQKTVLFLLNLESFWKKEYT